MSEGSERERERGKAKVMRERGGESVCLWQVDVVAKGCVC